MAEGVKGRERWVAAGLRWGFAALAVVVVARVAQLQLWPEEALASRLGQQWSERTLAPTRGVLLDRRGRPLATSHVGYRVFIDPERLERVDEAIPEIAGAAGLSEDDIGERIVAAMARADARAAAIDAWEADGADPESKLGRRIRFAPVTSLLPPERIDAMRKVCKRIKGVHLEPREVRRVTAGAEAAFLVGKVGQLEVGDPVQGLAGAERTLDAQLSGDGGQVRFVRDHRGRPLWIGPGAWSPPTDGSAMRLTIDLELQRIAMRELQRGIEDADAAGGRLVMIDPNTGDVLAIADILRDAPGVVEYPWVPKDPASAPEGWTPTEVVLDGTVRYRTQTADPWRDKEPSLARNRCVVDVYEPGSTIKPLIWAALTDAGVANPEEVFDTEGGLWRTSYGRKIEDVTQRDEMSWAEVLLHSSNVGMVKATERVTHDQLRALVRAYGLGEKTEIELPGESRGIVTSPKSWSKFTQTSVSFGYEIAVTPMQMARAFAALARSGDGGGTLPSLRLVGERPIESAGVVERVISPEAAAATRGVLVGVAGKAEAKMARRGEAGLLGAPAWRYGWFGKSGTAEIPLPTPPKGWKRPPGVKKAYFDRQYASSFIAAGPVDDARVLVVVVIDDPGPEAVNSRRYYGSDVAAPVARRVVERALGYLGVASDRESEQSSIILGRHAD